MKVAVFVVIVSPDHHEAAVFGHRQRRLLLLSGGNSVHRNDVEAGPSCGIEPTRVDLIETVSVAVVLPDHHDVTGVVHADHRQDAFANVVVGHVPFRKQLGAAGGESAHANPPPPVLPGIVLPDHHEVSPGRHGHGRGTLLAFGHRVNGHGCQMLAAVGREPAGLDLEHSVAVAVVLPHNHEVADRVDRHPGPRLVASGIGVHPQVGKGFASAGDEAAHENIVIAGPVAVVGVVFPGHHEVTAGGHGGRRGDLVAGGRAVYSAVDEGQATFGVNALARRGNEIIGEGVLVVRCGRVGRVPVAAPGGGGIAQLATEKGGLTARKHAFVSLLHRQGPGTDGEPVRVEHHLPHPAVAVVHAGAAVVAA